MDVVAKVLSPVEYYEEAKIMLEKKDFVEFVSNVSNAVLLSVNDREMLAKTTYLRAKGLISFYQYSKALEYIDEALKYNTGAEAFQMKMNKGVAKGYLGKIDEALEIFQTLISESDDITLLVGVYINIAWVHLTLNKDKNVHNLGKVKYYLNMVDDHFDSLSDLLKWKTCNTYSVYYFYMKEYEKAIEILENSIQYCNEEDLPDLYNNLADLYIKMAKESNGVVTNVAKDYLEKAEILGTQYKKTISLGYTFYFKAEAELMEEQLFTALDTLYLAFEYFKEAEATVMACDCLVKINKLMDEYKHNSLESLRENLKNKLKNTLYYEKV